MRAFWLIVGVVFGLAVVAMVRGGGHAGQTADRRAGEGEPIAVAPASGRIDAATPGSIRAEEPPAAIAPPPEANAASTTDAQAPAPNSPPPSIAWMGPPEPEGQASGHSDGGDPLETLAAQAAGLRDPRTPPAVPSAAPEVEAAGSPTAPGEGKPFEWNDDPVFGPDRYTESSATVRPDGAVVLDGRFVLRGSGTAEDPYRIPWELLESAQEVYKPRAGQKKLPRRVTFLHNKHVKIAGFVAFPIASNNPRECLVMLNQWDGCCIGVMPTAFDAVEVRLSKAATADQRMATHGELRGKFKVDPFEDGGWLISLYLMDDGALKADQ